MSIDIMKPHEFDAVYRLLEQSFPLDEYRPYDEQKALLNEPRYTVYVLHDEGGTVQAFIALWQFETISYIEHFAVDARYRNRGVGAAMLGELVARLPTPACLEAEPPEDDLACRRLRFYERNGFFVNPYPYMQPSISKGRKPLPLVMLTTGGTVDQATFESIKDTLYREVYHCR